MPKTILAVLAMAIAMLLVRVGAAGAQNYPWCAHRGDGGTNCGFVSFEQCMAASRFCTQNPMYQPPAQAPRSGRRRR